MVGEGSTQTTIWWSNCALPHVPLKIFQVHPMLCMSWYVLMIYCV
jgi:hypothetical protein